jgi:hypothetical protein
MRRLRQEFEMSKYKLVPLAIGTIVVLLSAVGGVSFADNTSKSTDSAGPQIPKSGGVVDLTTYQDEDGTTSTAVLTGAIGDYGKALRTYADGTVVRQYNRMDIEVSHGSFERDISNLEQVLVKVFGLFPTDRKSCSGIEVVHSTTPIAAGSGTGAYKGISGSFNLTVTINEVDSWPTCSRSDQSLLTQSTFVVGVGNVSLN